MRWAHSNRLVTPALMAVAAVGSAAVLPAVARGQATTQPVAPAPVVAVDTNSPKAAVKSFVEAEIKGDGKAIRDVLLTSSPTEERMATGIADLAVAIAELNRTMVAKFGPEKTEPIMGDKDAVLADVMAKLDKATEKVTGDAATVTSAPDATMPMATGTAGGTAGGATPPGAPPAAGGGGPSPQDTMALKKVGGQWKLSVADMAKGSSDADVQKTLSSVDAAVAGYKSVLADLTGGKLTTAEAVDAELRAKLSSQPGGEGGPAGGAAPMTPPGAK